jgi:hypothetical protein
MAEQIKELAVHNGCPAVRIKLVFVVAWGSRKSFLAVCTP